MTLEQQRAAMAFRHVQTLLQETAENRDLYGSMAQKLPVLIRTAGLCQAVHFVRSREKTKAVLGTLLLHLAQQLGRVEPKIQDGESLCDEVRNADLQTYLWLSREAVASAEWYARLSQSELHVDRTADKGD